MENLDDADDATLTQVEATTDNAQVKQYIVVLRKARTARLAGLIASACALETKLNNLYRLLPKELKW